MDEKIDGLPDLSGPLSNHPPQLVLAEVKSLL